jgi:Uma2 family endonuclease
MQTLVKLGPADHGRPLTREEFQSASYEGRYRYELIDGRLYVSPPPRFSHDWIVNWLFRRLDDYASRRPDVINYVSARSAVPVEERADTTDPEPDLAAFRDVPLDVPPEEVRWEDIQAVLVVEVISEDDAAKDLMRNPVLYLEVPSIREYWVIDPRPSADEPTLYVYRRRGARWQQRITVPFGGVYTTRLLPGFSLIVDPRR